MPRNRKPKPIEYEVDENGCHICTSHPSGVKKVNGKTEYIHRIIYIKRFGEPKEGKYIYRVCRNKRCINPEHMIEMTLSEYESEYDRIPIEYVVDDNGCHICTSHSKGIRLKGKSVNLHHYVYRTKIGEVPEGKIVVRKCGNEKCINVDHLTLITREELAKKIHAHPIEYEIDPVTGCHVCTSHHTNNKGYPVLVFNRKAYPVHRFVYEREHGKISRGKVVRHKCDNRRCVNPEHLELGTQADNMRDMVERGRSTRGSKKWSAKLTEDDVREIRKRLAAGDLGSDLAKVYGVNPTTIRDIKAGRTWKHVE